MHDSDITEADGDKADDRDPNRHDDSKKNIDTIIFENAAAPADTALLDLEDIGETLDAEAFEDPEDTEMLPEEEEHRTNPGEIGTTCPAEAPTNRIFQKSRPNCEKLDANILKQALAKWHARIEPEDNDNAASSASVWPALPAGAI